jgi:hypothetical protein
MNPRVLLGTGVLAAGLVALVLVTRHAADRPSWKTRDVWYNQSDVSLLATSGRPQLVEFFHPD